MYIYFKTIYYIYYFLTGQVPAGIKKRIQHHPGNTTGTEENHRFALPVDSTMFHLMLPM